MNQKLKLFSVVASIVMIASSLGFVTYALVQDNLNENHQGTVTITGTAQLEVKVEVNGQGENFADFTTISPATGYTGSKTGATISLSDVTFDAGKNYTFLVTVSNATDASIAAILKVLNFTFVEGENEYFDIVAVNVFEANQELAAYGDSVTYEFTFESKKNTSAAKGDSFDYNIKVEADIKVDE